MLLSTYFGVDLPSSSELRDAADFIDAVKDAGQSISYHVMDGDLVFLWSEDTPELFEIIKDRCIPFEPRETEPL